MDAVEKLPVDGDLFLLLLEASLGRRPEGQTNALLLAGYLLFLQSHADIEVVALVLLFDQSHPLVYLLFLQLDLADVRLVPVQAVHCQPQH